MLGHIELHTNCLVGEGEIMACLKYDLNDQRVQYLISTDEVLGKLIRYIGTSELVIEEDGFKCLVQYIIGQQISDKARETIWQKVCCLIGTITPSNLLRVNDDDLSGRGISGRKVQYIKGLAAAIVEKRLDLRGLPVLTNTEIITKLTALKGIGRWTAEMYLIFALGREDVCAKEDGSIRRVLQWMYGLEETPSAIVTEKYFVTWREYATIVSAYLWKAVSLGLTRMLFIEAISEG